MRSAVKSAALYAAADCCATNRALRCTAIEADAAAARVWRSDPDTSREVLAWVDLIMAEVDRSRKASRRGRLRVIQGGKL